MEVELEMEAHKFRVANNSINCSLSKMYYYHDTIQN